MTIRLQVVNLQLGFHLDLASSSALSSSALLKSFAIGLLITCMFGVVYVYFVVGRLVFTFMMEQDFRLHS